MKTEHNNYMHYTFSFLANTILVCLLFGQIPVLSQTALKVTDVLRSLLLYQIQQKDT